MTLSLVDLLQLAPPFVLTETPVAEPVISIVDPTNTHPDTDFTSLQAWEDFASQQAHAAQWAECYSGGNLGLVTLQNWNATPTALEYPYIYAAPGHGHNGRIDQGAFIEASTGTGIFANEVSYLRVEGMRVMMRGNSVIGIRGNRVAGFRAERNIVVSVDGENAARRGIVVQNTGDFVFVDAAWRVVNNLVTVQEAASQRFLDAVLITAGNAMQPGTSYLADVINNTLIPGTSGTGLSMAGSGDSSARRKGSIVNNVSHRLGDNFAVGFALPAGVTSEIIGSHNASHDATASVYGGSGHLTNIGAPGAIWEDPANHDYRPLRTGPLVDAGADVAGFGVTTDIAGRPRVVGAATDLGAFEHFDVVLRGCVHGRDAALWNAITSDRARHSLLTKDRHVWEVTAKDEGC